MVIWWPWRFSSFGCGKDRRADTVQPDKSLDLHDELGPHSALSALRSSSTAATSQWPWPWLIRRTSPTATNNLQTSHKGGIMKTYSNNIQTDLNWFVHLWIARMAAYPLSRSLEFNSNAQKLRHFCPSRCKQWWAMIEIQLLATQRYSKSHGKAWHKRLKAQADPRDPHLAWLHMGHMPGSTESASWCLTKTQHNWISCWKC
jgi:hypothetical protein